MVGKGGSAIVYTSPVAAVLVAGQVFVAHEFVRHTVMLVLYCFVEQMRRPVKEAGIGAHLKSMQDAQNMEVRLLLSSRVQEEVRVGEVLVRGWVRMQDAEVRKRGSSRKALRALALYYTLVHFFATIDERTLVASCLNVLPSPGALAPFVALPPSLSLFPVSLFLRMHIQELVFLHIHFFGMGVLD